MNEVNLCVIEREETIGLAWELARKDVSVGVGRVVIVGFVVAHSRHERSVCRKLLGEFPEEIPDWLAFSFCHAVHPGIGNISSQEDKVEGFGEVVFCYFIDDKIAKRSKGAHISKNSDI